MFKGGGGRFLIVCVLIRPEGKEEKDTQTFERMMRETEMSKRDK